jgi:hypothetical protein
VTGQLRVLIASTSAVLRNGRRVASYITAVVTSLTRQLAVRVRSSAGRIRVTVKLNPSRHCVVSVETSLTGWTVRGSNPGMGKIFPFL